MLEDSNIQFPILNEHSKINISSMPTMWNVKHSCCCCGPYVELSIPNSRKKRYFLRGWEFQPLMPIIIVSLILFTTITYFICIFPHQSLVAQIIMPIFISILLVLSIWSYFACVFMDPGYLPFNWAQTKRFSYTWEEQLSGLAVISAQFNYALLKENRPPKCSFSHSAGRFVIRGDHICGWAANWIGKRNHKQFILMNLYSGLFASTLVIGSLFVPHFFSLPKKILITAILAIFVEIAYAIFVFSAFGSTMIDLVNNRTKLNKMKDNANINNSQLNERKISFTESMQEVCGNSSYLYWMIPLPAFDDLLVIDDDPDDMFHPLDEFVFRKNDFFRSSIY